MGEGGILKTCFLLRTRSGSPTASGLGASLCCHGDPFEFRKNRDTECQRCVQNVETLILQDVARSKDLQGTTRKLLRFDLRTAAGLHKEEVRISHMLLALILSPLGAVILPMPHRRKHICNDNNNRN